MIDLDTGEVLACISAAATTRRNYAVPAAALSRDDRVIAAGVEIRRQAARRPDGMVGLVAARGCRRDRGRHWPMRSCPERGRPVRRRNRACRSRPSGGSVVIEVPLRITISLGAAVAGHGRRRSRPARPSPRRCASRTTTPTIRRARATIRASSTTPRKGLRSSQFRCRSRRAPRRWRRPATATPCCTTRIFRCPCMPSGGWRCSPPPTSPRRRS